MTQVKCLYVMYWGATEPIGQSGPIPTIGELGRAGEEIVLVSFDKPADKANEGVTAKIARRLAETGAVWIDLGYTKKPANLSTAWDIAKGVAAGSWLVRRHGVSVVHGRTYVGAIIGALIRSTTPDVRFVCHEDGFWPNEKVDDGFWKEGGRPHRLGLAIERYFHRRADAIIVLSERARDRLRQDPSLAGIPIHVVHTSVDVDRFAERPARLPTDPLRLIHLGSLGRRYLAVETFAFLRSARRRMPEVELTVATRMPDDLVDRALVDAGLTPQSVDRVRLEPVEVPAVLARHHAGIFFLRDGISNVATSATKVGEYLAAGMGVVLTPHCGDLHEIVESTRTGVVVREHSERAYEEALGRLVELTAEPELPARARAVASRFMGLRGVAEAQARIHRDLADQISRRSASSTRRR